MTKTFIGWLQEQVLNEADTRYSVEVNYRSKTKEIMDSAAKICLGYASAALKQMDFHVKQVFEEEPYRIMVSSRNWDDGEWVVIVSWNPEQHCYVLTKGHYNKDLKTVTKQGSHKIDAENAADITREAKNALHNLKDVPDKHIEKLKKVPLKRGPK